MFPRSTRVLMTLLVWGSLVIVSCGGPQLKIEPIATSENPTEQIGLLAQAIHDGRERNLDVLSPTFFSEAESSLRTATALRDRGSDISKIFRSVAEGRAQLKKADEMAKIARVSLVDAIDARDNAQAVGAAVFGKDYDRAEQGFLRLTGAIEKNDLEWSKTHQSDTVAAFRDLELRGIKQAALGDIRAAIDRAIDGGAKKSVPQSLMMAQEKLQEADDFIADNRYEAEDIRKRASIALFYTNRLQQMMQEASAVRGKDAEEIALWVEQMLSDIRAGVPAPDSRDQSLAVQVETIKSSIGSLKQSHQTDIARLQTEQQVQMASVKAEKELLTGEARAKEGVLLEQTMAQKQELERLTQQLAAITGQSQKELAEKRRLEAQIRFNQLYSEVQAYFESNEAEVYKQGDQLLIRLKGMRFPIGQYVIMPEDFALLTKVQRAVRAFGTPRVVIEGHTDSTGSVAKNEGLSQQRAASVREYLVANGVVASDKIQAVGFGSQKPLATNNTPEGRSLNRRIDVIIQPVSK